MLAVASVAIVAALLAPTSAHANFTLSGTATTDEAGNVPWKGCDGTTANVAMSYDGVALPNVPCNKSTGAFSFPVTTGTSNRLIAVYLDAAGQSATGGGIVYTRNNNSTSAINAVGVVQRRVTLDTRSGTNLQAAHLAQWNDANDGTIPVTVYGGNEVEVDPGYEIHVASGKTVVLNRKVTTPKLHIPTTSTVQQTSELWLTEGGTGSCADGPPHMRPLCVEGTGALTSSNWVVFDVDGDTVIDAGPTYDGLTLRSNRASIPQTTFTIGTAAGQALKVAKEMTTSNCWCQGEMIVDASRWDPNWQLGTLWLGHNTTINQDGAGTMSVTGQVSGSGVLDVPRVDVTVDSTLDRSQFGGGSERIGGDYGAPSTWDVGSLTLRSNEDRSNYGRNVNNGGAVDNFLSVYDAYISDTYEERGVGVTSTNGGDWLVERANAPGTFTWNSGGTVGDTAVAAVPWRDSSAVGHTVVVGATYRRGGDWAIGIFNEDGTQYTAFASATNAGETVYNNVRTWDSGTSGADVPVGVVVGEDDSGNARIFVYGTGAMNGGDWVVRSYDPYTGALDQEYTWNSGGAQADVMRTGAVQGYGDSVLLGGSAGTNGGDFAVRLFRTGGWSGTVGWVDSRPGPTGCSDVTGACTINTGCSIQGLQCYRVWNSGGTNPDQITALFAAGYTENGSAHSDDPASDPQDWWCGAYVAGTTRPGANDDWYLARFCNGSVDTTFGGGAITWDSGGGGNDVPLGIISWNQEVTLFGRSGAAGNPWTMRRYDFDGDLDQTFGTNGVVTGAAGDQRTAGVSQWGTANTGIGGQFVLVGYNAASGGGDGLVQAYDFDGTAATGSASGVTIFQPRVGERGSGPVVNVHGDLTVGSASGDQARLNIDNSDTNFNVDGSVNVAATGTVRASSTSPLTVGGDVTLTGTWLAQGGRVELVDRARPSALSWPAGRSFGTLAINAPGKRVTLPNNGTTATIANLEVTGGSCASPVFLTGVGGGTTANVAPTAATVSYARITNVTASGSPSATNSAGSGTTTGWTITGACGAATQASPGAMQVGAIEAQTGTRRATGIATNAPKMSWTNAATTTIDKQSVEVANTFNDASVRNLWHADATGVNPSPDVATGASGCGNMVKTGSATWVASNRAGFGNALQVTGSTSSYAQTASTCAMAGSYSVDLWFRLADAASCNGAQGKQVLARTTTSAFVIRLACDDASQPWVEGCVTHVSTDTTCSSAPAPGADDHRWHHAALVLDGSARNVQAYFDGRNRAGYGTAVYRSTWTPRTAASTVQLGCSSSCTAFTGELDELRIRTGASTSDDLRGYVGTERPHGTILWESDPLPEGTETGVAIAACAAGARCADITYAGPEIVKTYARYWARARYVLQSTATWTEWSTPDWFDVGDSISVSVVAGENVSFGAVVPGVDSFGRARVTVSSTSPYVLSVRDGDDSAGGDSGYASVADWTGTPDTPTTWNAGVTGGFGVALLAVNGAKDAAQQARWGTSLVNGATSLKFAGLRRTTSTVLVSTTTGSDQITPAPDTIDVGYRVNPPTTQQPGRYVNQLVYTALPRP